MPLPPRRTRRLVLLGIVAAVSLLLCTTAVVQFRADASWEAMQTQIEAIERDHARSRHRRDPAWGTSTPDAAFTCYERAAGAVAPIEREQTTKLREYLTSTDAAVAAETGMRSRWRTVLEALRAGAHAHDTG